MRKAVPAGHAAQQRRGHDTDPSRKEWQPSGPCRSEPSSPLFAKAFEVARIGTQIPRSDFKPANQTGLSCQFICGLTSSLTKVALQSLSNNFRLRAPFYISLLLQTLAKRRGDSDGNALRRHVRHYSTFV